MGDENWKERNLIWGHCNNTATYSYQGDSDSFTKGTAEEEKKRKWQFCFQSTFWTYEDWWIRCREELRTLEFLIWITRETIVLLLWWQRMEGESVKETSTRHRVPILSFFGNNRVYIKDGNESSWNNFCFPFLNSRCVPTGWVLANKT